jgi:hypothetical protein
MTRILVVIEGRYWYCNTDLFHDRARIFAEALEVAYARMAVGEWPVEIVMDDGGSASYVLRS